MASFLDGSPTVNALQFTLDGLSQRVQATTNNIANADTPNFKASVVSFQQSLRNALAGGSNDPLPMTMTDGADINPGGNAGQATITETPLLNLVSKNDGNNVDIEHEMTTLAASNIMYDAMVQLTSTKMSMYRSSIAELQG
ncbi:MAG: flagellar basal body rod protein FlgB [Chloroflexota bacterium]